MGTTSVDFRRRRTGRTDYQQRLKLLKSGKPRAVIRTTNNQTLVQLVTYDPTGDNTEAAYHSTQLQRHGWDEHPGNLPAAYLTGYAAGLHAQEQNISEAVADFGLETVYPGNRLFAAIAGLHDAGVDVPASQDVLPEEHRRTGAHINDSVPDTVETVKNNLDDEVTA